MGRQDVEFKTSDRVTLRGWFYTSDLSSGKSPCLVMSHGFSALKEMDLNTFAEYFVSTLPISCLVYDNRGFGDSDAAEGEPRSEIVPMTQCSDISDAITYAASREEVNPDKIGIWGSSYSGGHVLYVGAVDRRVKVVLSQVPCVSGWDNFNRLVRPDFAVGFNATFAADRITRAQGGEPGMVPVVDADPLKPSALPTPDSYEFFSSWEKKSQWKNTVTVKTIELFRAYEPQHLIEKISPTPLLMTVASGDVLTPTDLALGAYARAKEPKQLSLLPGGHFDAYSGPFFERNAGTQAAFLKKWLVDA
ncbi:uncharacterized protein Z518_01472 [Rhinocladiella mackenziei CBS 650.93]|uniref:Xaa-Pro dipeptidyl-peptidase-like domain-containing protein n=1 Tax=Rhinocladiella mackenziei CBS 650.93 TaxID=1442369 RepID=A0A0D2JLP0_9EURO|nr:uncharacterized protein Z518_01472 [Rhinocladiella mackenziei CBS 650.93]KIX10390.1 hypothetical protein Z518_01472 [Rhinocladiella mackenziei CBS 650.93]